ncbi:hypothetical protein M8J77_008341 [Diaphorina citri]|nr:hypothetical protein M8J77_008341 [Diaphorina citri]
MEYSRVPLWLCVVGLLVIFQVTQVTCQLPQPISSCERKSCYPATGNLLIGRENKLRASSTCGLHGNSTFCIVSFLEDKKKCFTCNSSPRFDNNPAFSHKIHNIVYATVPRTKTISWWQSENGVENVTIQLDMEAEFHFTHLIIYFKTFRPAAMLIERSHDFGKTWQVYRYFAADCAKSFSGIPRDGLRKLTDVYCESRYSSNNPSSGGEVILRVLPPSLHHSNIDPYSSDVQNLIKMTNLRINFTKLHTLGDDLLDTRRQIQEKYYYAITQMIVRGSCSCYGHASRCLPISEADTKPDMVHGRCECTHNTQGLNCEKCIDFYNDLPWKPAFGSQTNACKQCNCNNHSTKCHFDEAVYNSTGRISGGVCDSCEHNTEGRNCERCKQYFYKDPNKEFSDPEVCLRCDCDPGGSLDDGICDPYTDDVLVSGKCHCKPNVGGRRCDMCKDGFWNFNETNPNGCEPCTCNIQGTINSQGCNKDTGDCTCKRNVEGRDCNQCLPHFWGLSESEEYGCKPCDCDPGASYDNNCDVISGQCKCKPHASGRTCSTPEQSYYSPPYDNFLYEAENANCKTDKCVVEIRQPLGGGNENTWTGPGFMKGFENTGLVFEIDNIPTPMDYDIVVRYEPVTNTDWENVDVIVEREGNVDINGPCGNAVPQDDIKRTRLPVGSRAVKVYPPACLEPGKKYKVHLIFHQDNNGTTGPSASILIDSIALLPNIQSIPFFQGPENFERAREFDHYRCGDSYITVYRGVPIPEACKKQHYSIGMYVHHGANECDCDPTGSTSKYCDQLGGNCVCKPNVVGRRCDRCAPGTYGFGPEGCKACDCNHVGALDNICDVVSGQCKCRAQTYGRECDQCSPGYWNYPTCQRCICNGHADLCDSKTGTCISCRNSTDGENCERCINGYYGDPRLGIDIPCRPCPCPGTVESGLSYADTCQLDPRSQDVICECKEGYRGTRCDGCLDNYFGNPQERGGSCEPCDCSNNTDLALPGNCDTLTGKCLQCRYDTEGDHCQVCKAGFFGNALEQNCTECTCNILGIDHSKGPCDRTTGQCPCLPNVIGVSCDRCLKNHWKIASGTGCEPCDCDPIGSVDVTECNEYTGQCQCKSGFGGRQCDQCQTNFWGNPNVECFPCDCDPSGSATSQCHQNNGTCVCHQGIGGVRCDTCARGYIGTAPDCSPCGECFDNWDSILRGLADQTTKVITDASNIKQTGASGAYTKEFELLEKKIEDVKALVENTTRSSHDLTVMLTTIDDMKKQIMNNEDPNGVGKTLGNTTQRINLARLALNDLTEEIKKLNKTGEMLKENATLLQENNVEGALELTRQAHDTSLKLKEQSTETEKQINDAERQCKRTENLVTKTFPQFTQGQEENEKALQRLNEKITSLEKNLPDLNELICDKRGDPCDNLCGGAGCGKCGGMWCSNGTLSESNSAKDYAETSKKLINEKEAKAEEVFRGITTAKQESHAANILAKEAYDHAASVRNKTAAYVASTSNITKQLDEFLNAPGATLADIRNISGLAVNKNIQSNPEQIRERANEINNVIKSLTDIDTILTETAGDLAKANDLKRKANLTKAGADSTKNTVQKIVDVLTEARTAQDMAEVAIQTAKDDISAARKDLSQITNDLDDAQQKSNETNVKVKLLQERLKSIQAGFLQNGRSAMDVENEEKNLEKEVALAQKQASGLRSRYQETDNKLLSKAESSGLKRARGQMLLNKASQLSVNTTAKLKQLNETEAMFNSQESELTELSKNIAELQKRIQSCINFIVDKSNNYKNCVS